MYIYIYIYIYIYMYIHICIYNYNIIIYETLFLGTLYYIQNPRSVHNIFNKVLTLYCSFDYF